MQNGSTATLHQFLLDAPVAVNATNSFKRRAIELNYPLGKRVE